MKAQIEFIRRLRAVVDLVGDGLSEEQRSTITRMIDNNEGGEAMLTLASVIVEGDIAVPPSARDEIWNLAEGLVNRRDFPPQFWVESGE